MFVRKLDCQIMQVILESFVVWVERLSLNFDILEKRTNVKKLATEIFLF